MKIVINESVKSFLERVSYLSPEDACIVDSILDSTESKAKKITLKQISYLIYKAQNISDIEDEKAVLKGADDFIVKAQGLIKKAEKKAWEYIREQGIDHNKLSHVDLHTLLEIRAAGLKAGDFYKGINLEKSDRRFQYNYRESNPVSGSENYTLIRTAERVLDRRGKVIKTRSLYILHDPSGREILRENGDDLRLMSGASEESSFLSLAKDKFGELEVTRRNYKGGFLSTVNG